MASVNVADRTPLTTHEGAPAARISVEQQLRRSVLSCLLWEDEFYEDGVTIADRIAELAAKVAPETLASLAIEARQQMHLRHVPLLLLNVLTRTGAGSRIVQDTFPEVIRRADELGEFLAIYWMNGKHPLSAGAKKGLSRAFANFDEYQLTKYKGDGKVRIRDVMFLTHPKPTGERSALYQALADDTASAPDTWEVALSRGADKKETFERLLREGSLGYLALLRNLRGMAAAGVDDALIREALIARKGAHNVLPFRFVAAAKAAPKFERELDKAMLAGLAQLPRLPGKTVVVVDVSGSMYGAHMSAKSDMNRATVACALGAIVQGVAEHAVIYPTAGSDAARKHATNEMPPREGMAMVDAIYAECRPLGGGGIFLKQVMDFIAERESGISRTIVITDEQDCAADPADSPKNARCLGLRNYMINVASAKNGVGYGKWTHIDGFSENVMRYIATTEAEAGE
ncbi:hypothetical protein AYO38_07515 [bacterium SCGC AG-212-C10]|nr:hypothetical protein AYO38_07515 [bacterium SCGC AG-212-C10]